MLIATLVPLRMLVCLQEKSTGSQLIAEFCVLTDNAVPGLKENLTAVYNA